MIKAKSLLNIDQMIFVNIHGWFNNCFEFVLKNILNSITSSNPIILFSAGMGTKVLITEIYKLYPQATYIDIGSCLDILLTKKDSRGWRISYNDVEKYYQQILPDDWNESKYDYIYDIAKNELGKHL